MTKLRMLFEKVLVRPDEENIKEGLLSVPYMSRKPVMTGTVISMGPGKKLARGLLRANVEAGNRIAFKPREGVEIRVDDIYHLILRPDQILGVLHE